MNVSSMPFLAQVLVAIATDVRAADEAVEVYPYEGRDAVDRVCSEGFALVYTRDPAPRPLILVFVTRPGPWAGTPPEALLIRSRDDRQVQDDNGVVYGAIKEKDVTVNRVPARGFTPEAARLLAGQAVEALYAR